MMRKTRPMGMPTASPSFLALLVGEEWVVLFVVLLLVPWRVMVGPGRGSLSALSLRRERVRFVVEAFLFSHKGLILRKTAPWEFGALVSWSMVMLSVESWPRSSRERRAMVLVELGGKRDWSHVTV